MGPTIQLRLHFANADIFYGLDFPTRSWDRFAEPGHSIIDDGYNALSLLESVS